MSRSSDANSQPKSLATDSGGAEDAGSVSSRVASQEPGVQPRAHKLVRAGTGRSSMRRLAIKQCISTPGGLVAVVGANVVLLARYCLSEDCLDALDAACSECERQHGRFGFFSLLEVGLPLPRSRGVQERMERLMARHTQNLYAAALVFEGAGFEATMVRSSVTAVNMASRARHPSRVFSRLNEGVTWMLGYCPTAAPRSPLGLGQSGVPQADPRLVADLSSAISLLRSSWRS